MSSAEERMEKSKELIKVFEGKINEVDELEKLYWDIYNKKNEVNKEITSLRSEIINSLTPYKKDQLLKLTSPLGKIKYYRLNNILPRRVNWYYKTKEFDIRELLWDLELKRVYISSNKETIKSERYFCNLDGIPQGTFKTYYGSKRYKQSKSFLEMGSWKIVEKVGE